MSADADAVASLLGRRPEGRFEVVVRSESGVPAVIRNEPFLIDGTPMPTLFWLVDPVLCAAVGRLESGGGVREAESEIEPAAIGAAHARYARQRDSDIPSDHLGPAPEGGVGGTRTGVKCLHAHLAWWLAGGDDPVGSWTASRIGLHQS
ncbi:MAG: DUF501 domain-containing protein [Acidimicrobiales bacterium]